MALAESCLAPKGELGVRVNCPSGYERVDALLFGESQSRIMVSLSPGDLDKTKGYSVG